MTKPLTTTSKGEFESSFAGGLDLSEFVNTNKKTSTIPQKSAAKEGKKKARAAAKAAVTDGIQKK